MNAFNDWLDHQDTSRVRVVTVGLLLALLVAAALEVVTGVGWPLPWIGGATGVGMYAVGRLWLRRDATVEVRERLAIRGRVRLPRRRAGIIAVAAVLVVVLLGFGRGLPDFTDGLVGAVLVAAVLAGMATWLATAEEIEAVEEYLASLEGEADGVDDGSGLNGIERPDGTSR